MAVTHVTKDTFENEVRNSDKPVLIDFYADWCGPCKMLGPIVEEISNEQDKVKIVKINIDQEQELAAAFQVRSIPTLAFVKNGEVVDAAVGAQPKDAILNMINK